MRTATFISALFLTVALITTGIPGPAPAAEFNLKFQIYLPPELAGPNQQMAADIERMSNHRIKMTVLTAGELVSSPDTLKACKAGVIDVVAGSGYHYSELKSGAIQAGLPMTWQSGVEAEVLWEKMGFRELVAKSFEPYGVHYLGPMLLSPYAMTSKVPIRSLDDLRKIKLRAASSPAKMFKELGINSVYIKTEEMYLALSTGQVDGVLWGGATDYEAMKFQEVSPYYCSSYIVNPIVDSIFINKKTWNRMPDDLKAIVEQAVHRCSWNYVAFSMDGEYKSQSTTYKDKVTTLPQEDIYKLTEAAQKVWEEEAQKDELNRQMVEKIKVLLRSLGRLK